ncbi:MAG: hypothetical protein M5U34_32015 [Chloroflexi bacterium]|nr:hypothetical protein [Chloroflexota bacterium]
MDVAQEGRKAEFSYGTHFFQDLVESGIYSLALQMNDGRSIFNRDFFLSAPNCLADLSPADAALSAYLQVIDLAAVTPGKRMKIVMDGSIDKAIGYLEEGGSDEVGHGTYRRTS